MKYIDQLNAFDSWLNGNYLSPLAKTLWYRLMAINNRTRWQEWFQVSNQVLQGELDSNYDTFCKYRKELLENGLIEYRRGKKGTSPFYKIIKLISTEESGIYPETNPNINPLINSDITPDINRELDLKNKVNTQVNPTVNEQVNTQVNQEVNSLDINILRLDKTRRDETKQDNTSSAKAEQASLDYGQIMDIWNENCNKMSKIKSIQGNRRKRLRNLFKEFKLTEDSFKDAVIKASKSDFLNGLVKPTNGRKPFKATFDWTIKTDNFAKITEGNYDNRKSSNQLEISEDRKSDYQNKIEQEFEEIVRASNALENQEYEFKYEATYAEPEPVPPVFELDEEQFRNIDDLKIDLDI